MLKHDHFLKTMESGFIAFVFLVSWHMSLDLLVVWTYDI